MCSIKRRKKSANTYNYYHRTQLAIRLMNYGSIRYWMKSIINVMIIIRISAFWSLHRPLVSISVCRHYVIFSNSILTNHIAAQCTHSMNSSKNSGDDSIIFYVFFVLSIAQIQLSTPNCWDCCQKVVKYWNGHCYH